MPSLSVGKLEPDSFVTNVQRSCGNVEEERAVRMRITCDSAGGKNRPGNNIGGLKDQTLNRLSVFDNLLEDRLEIVSGSN